MLGVENIKKVLSFAFALGTSVEQALADGKVNLSDLPLLLAPLMKASDAIEGAKTALQELKDLSAEERAALDAWAKAEFNLADDKLEEKIEKGLGLALHVAEFVEVVKA